MNPIEKAWNIIKGQWRRTSFLMLDNNRKTDEKIADAVNFIQSIADVLDLEKMKKVAHSNYKVDGADAERHHGVMVMWLFNMVSVTIKLSKTK